MAGVCPAQGALIRKAADQDAHAQFQLGQDLEWRRNCAEGLGVRKAAEQGNVKRSTTLGICTTGSGRAPGLHTSGYWFRKAAEQGDASAIGLGFCTTRARVCLRTTPKPLRGIVRLPNKVSPTRKLPRRPVPRRLGLAQGLHPSAAWCARRRNRVTSGAHLPWPILRLVKTCPRISRKPISGSIWRLLASLIPQRGLRSFETKSHHT